MLPALPVRSAPRAAFESEVSFDFSELALGFGPLIFIVLSPSLQYSGKPLGGKALILIGATPEILSRKFCFFARAIRARVLMASLPQKVLWIYSFTRDSYL